MLQRLLRNTCQMFLHKSICIFDQTQVISYLPVFNLGKGGTLRPVFQPHIKRFYHKMNDGCSLISLKMTQFTLIKPWRMSYLGRGSPFRGGGRTLALPGRAEPQAVWYSFVIMGSGMDISVVLSYHHSTAAHTQTPLEHFSNGKYPHLIR